MIYRIAAVVLFLVGLYTYGHHVGWNERDQEMQAEIARKNEEARTKEQELSKQITDQSYKLKEANDAVTQKQTALDRAIRAGRVRLPAASCVQADASAGPATGGGNEAATESERQTLAAIAAIVADGDKAINQLNACIDAYNKVKESVNGQR